MNVPVRGAHASRCLRVRGVLAIANFCCGFNDTKRPVRRDAESQQARRRVRYPE